MTITPQSEPPGDVAVVIAAGGAGVRLGPGLPKALRPLAGQPVLCHAVRGVLAADGVACVVVAVPSGAEAAVRQLLSTVTPLGGPTGPPGVLVTTGGAERQQSVAAALAAVPERFGIVLVHDAARALTPPEQTARVAAAVRGGHRAVIPVLPVTDTIAEVDPAGTVVGSPDRSVLRAVQTPQGFRRETLVAAHAAATGEAATDDAGLVARLGVPVATVPGSPYAMKITTPHDLTVAAALLAAGAAA